MFNWGSCCDSTGGTPGKENCKSPKLVDAACVSGSLCITPERPYYTDPILTFVDIENVGCKTVHDVAVVFAVQSVGNDLFTSFCRYYSNREYRISGHNDCFI